MFVNRKIEKGGIHGKSKPGLLYRQGRLCSRGSRLGSGDVYKRQTLSRQKVQSLIELLPDTLIVVDEAYMEFSPNESVLDLTGQYDHLIVLKTCSKALGLAGLRLGFAVADKTLAKALQAVKSPYSVNALSQAVGEAVLENSRLGEFLSLIHILLSSGTSAQIPGDIRTDSWNVPYALPHFSLA